MILINRVKTEGKTMKMKMKRDTLWLRTINNKRIGKKECRMKRRLLLIKFRDNFKDTNIIILIP